MRLVRTRSLLLTLVLVGAVSAAAALADAGPPPAPRGAAQSAVSRLVVTLPHADAIVKLDDRIVVGSGTSRELEVPAGRGATRRLTIAVEWKPNGYTTMTRTRTVSFKQGERVNVDLSADQPNDRVKVMYVPTPTEIADEMVKLAGVGPSDVVFEPGCGDARITIAAVKAGARRGVGIDIDADRVADSRVQVKAAGLADRIEIRLGDALDIKDLSSATVVFLYMGDHFNLLIRPQLWKQLPVGARVVSHRFTMGDWKPEQSVAVGGFEGGDYELHLWRITEDLKRKAASPIVDAPRAILSAPMALALRRSSGRPERSRGTAGW
jgi:uncharacterized protein (TIGR03000 family)